MTESETGPDFERRGLDVARAMYDPAGLQGSVMIDGREHDGVFVGDDALNVFEFTTRRDKVKAEKDVAKM
jgi:hypothetical protein